MSSKALYLSKVAPQFVHRLEVHRAAVEVWTTTCIVLNFGRAVDCPVLMNPANPQLSGVGKFPYFPRGGPVPQQAPAQFEHHIMGHVSKWGGMDVGHGMLFPVSVIDGLVHTYGGWQLQAALQWYRLRAVGAEACPIGSAVRTTAGSGSKLSEAYETVIHTPPPFYHYPPDSHNKSPAELLSQCYASALDQLEPSETRIATPLLGAGCRGFPLDVALAVAAEATVQWCRAHPDRDVTVAFALLEQDWAEQMRDLLVGSST
jgi:O-acetyl-ADP-ribose deacetylase (regulator of RNase III)